jgi:hypothetical protein
VNEFKNLTVLRGGYLFEYFVASRTLMSRICGCFENSGVSLSSRSGMAAIRGMLCDHNLHGQGTTVYPVDKGASAVVVDRKWEFVRRICILFGT